MGPFADSQMCQLLSRLQTLMLLAPLAWNLLFSDIFSSFLVLSLHLLACHHHREVSPEYPVLISTSSNSLTSACSFLTKVSPCLNSECRAYLCWSIVHPILQGDFLEHMQVSVKLIKANSTQTSYLQKVFEF